MKIKNYQINEEEPDFVRQPDYVIADPHFNHKNIINPNSPVDCRSDDLAEALGKSQGRVTVAEMNDHLINEWNRRVSSDEVVVILGDFHLGTKPHSPETIYERLNGEKILVVGDHDIYEGKLDLPEQAEPQNHKDLNYWGIIETPNNAYLATHYPDDNPKDIPGGNIAPRIQPTLPANLYQKWDGKILAGHHHNNWLGDNNHAADYPLIHPKNQRANVGVELTNYGPIAIETLDMLFQAGNRIETAHNIDVSGS